MAIPGPFGHNVRMARPQIAVTAVSLGNDPRQIPRLSRQAGFSGLQFDAFWTPLRLTDLSISGRREFQRLVIAENQKLVGLRHDIGPKGLGPGSDVDRILSELDRVMQAARDLAAPLICVDLGALPAPVAVNKPKPKVTPEQAGLLILPPEIAPAQPDPPPTNAASPSSAHVDAALSELGRLADRYSVTLAFRSELAAFAALEQALRHASCPWFGVDLDPVAMARDQWEMDEIFSRLGPLVFHVRGRDASIGAERRTRPAVLGQGDVPWESLLAALDQAGYHGWITLDPGDLPDRPAAAMAGLKYLAAL